MRGIVDRLEGCIAVCEMDGRQMLDIPQEQFSELPKSGDVFEYDGRTARILRKETEEQKESVQSLFERLKKKQVTL